MNDGPGPGKPALTLELPDGRRLEAWFLHRVLTAWVGHPNRKKSAHGPREGTACILAVSVPGGPPALQRVITSHAIVHPGDTYSRPIGRRRSFAKAVIDLGLAKEDRSHAWQEFLQRGW